MLREGIKIANRATVNIILGDYSSLTTKYIFVPEGATLNIVAQSTGAAKGSLLAGRTGTLDNQAGIGGNDKESCGYISIVGGNIEVYGGANAAGLGKGTYSASDDCGYISVYGGTVKATGGINAAGIGGGGNAAYQSSGGMDWDKTLDENKAVIDAVITQLGSALADQRAADEVIAKISDIGTV